MNRTLFVLSFFVCLVGGIKAQTLVPQNLIATQDTSFCPPDTFFLSSFVQGCDYSVDSIPYQWYSVGGTSMNMSDDQIQGPFNIGFTFDYFCNFTNLRNIVQGV